MLTIHLAEKRDEVDCLSAWVSAKEADFPTQDGLDVKCEFVVFLVPLLFLPYVSIHPYANIRNFGLTLGNAKMG